MTKLTSRALVPPPPRVTPPPPPPPAEEDEDEDEEDDDDEEEEGRALVGVVEKSSEYVDDWVEDNTPEPSGIGSMAPTPRPNNRPGPKGRYAEP